MFKTFLPKRLTYPFVALLVFCIVLPVRLLRADPVGAIAGAAQAGEEMMKVIVDAGRKESQERRFERGGRGQGVAKECKTQLKECKKRLDLAEKEASKAQKRLKINEGKDMKKFVKAQMAKHSYAEHQMRCEDSTDLVVEKLYQKDHKLVLAIFESLEDGTFHSKYKNKHCDMEREFATKIKEDSNRLCRVVARGPLRAPIGGWSDDEMKEYVKILMVAQFLCVDN